jgi:DDE superfamily endonuclease
VISGITPGGRLLLQIQDHAFRTPDVVQLLRHLLRHLPGKVLVIWDGAPIHRGRPIKEFLSQGAVKRLRLEQLPGYAPDPQMKASGATSNTSSFAMCAVPICTISITTLRLATTRLRHKRAVIRGCVTHCGHAL